MPFFPTRAAKGLRGFSRDEDGGASTEWMVAVAIVVMMAVPVMAVIGNGSETSSEEMVVQIEDADSFGGAGFQPNEARLPAEEDANLYNPGADLGVGMPEEDAQVRTASAAANFGRSAGQFAASGRRDKSTFGTGGGTLGRGPTGGGGLVTGTPAAPSTVGGETRVTQNAPNPVALPELPAQTRTRLRMSTNDCNDLLQYASGTRTTGLILTSGR